MDGSELKLVIHPICSMTVCIEQGSVLFPTVPIGSLPAPWTAFESLCGILTVRLQMLSSLVSQSLMPFVLAWEQREMEYDVRTHS